MIRTGTSHGVDAPSRSMLRGAIRLSAIALGSGMALLGSSESRIVAGVALGYGLLRLFALSDTRSGGVADVVAAGVLTLATGGPKSGFAAFSVVAALSIGFDHGWKLGAVAGGSIGAITAGTALQRLDLEHGYLSATVAWFALFPLAGAAGGLIARARPPVDPAIERLQRANRALAALHDAAREMPGSLDVSIVAHAVRDEIRDSSWAAAGAVVGFDDERLDVLASFGEIAAVDPYAVMNAAVAGSISFQKDTAGCWMVAPAARGARRFGAIVARCAHHETHEETAAILQRLSTEMAVAMENVDLFRRVALVSASDERRRIAAQVHEGLAQTLTHLRLEVDFIVRHGTDTPDSVREDLARMSTVLDRAVADLRTLMDALRTHSPLPTTPERVPA